MSDMDKIDKDAALIYGLIPPEARPAAHRIALRYAADISALRTAYRNGEEGAEERLLPRLRSQVAALGSLIPEAQRPAGQMLVDDLSADIVAYVDAELAKAPPEAVK
jgi:hypothetical protein